MSRRGVDHDALTKSIDRTKFVGELFDEVHHKESFVLTTDENDPIAILKIFSLAHKFHLES